ncbi:tetratricopeptide repeat protein 19 [Holotrichia oblita]|uniref:Tetratricopeptide repeat protein 19 n=2 Tax=Holotrichia oblita TaxID=644536 RepID=A0ACB9TCR8_HOLOL|nr:tetratricopeptide repeat protein 19 [Holotrichia oblita]
MFNYIAVPILFSISLLSTDTISSNISSDVEDNITHLIVLAKIALEKGDFDKAEALLQVGLKICQDYDMSYGLPIIYDILASIAFSQGDTRKAESLLVTAIERMTLDGVSENNDHIIDFKLRLARIYSAHKENSLAEIGFKTCLDVQKDKITKGDMSTKTGMIYINILFWYGVHMIKNSRYNEAKKMINHAYDYSTKIKGLSPYQEMVILYTLADLNMELGEYDVALVKMQTAVMLGKGISSSDLPRCYLKLARIYMKMGVYDQATSAVLEGEKLARMFNKTDTVNDAKVLLDEIKQMNK